MCGHEQSPVFLSLKLTDVSAVLFSNESVNRIEVTLCCVCVGLKRSPFRGESDNLSETVMIC